MQSEIRIHSVEIFNFSPQAGALEMGKAGVPSIGKLFE